MYGMIQNQTESSPPEAMGSITPDFSAEKYKETIDPVEQRQPLTRSMFSQLGVVHIY